MASELGLPNARAALTEPRRQLLSRRIRWFVAATITYNVIEATVALTEGTRGSSTALIGFGLDSVIEVSSAAAVAWQFAGADPEAREKVALRIIALSFYGLAIYVTADAIRSLFGLGEARHSTIGIALGRLCGSVAKDEDEGGHQPILGGHVGVCEQMLELFDLFICGLLPGGVSSMRCDLDLRQPIALDSPGQESDQQTPRLGSLGNVAVDVGLRNLHEWDRLCRKPTEKSHRDGAPGAPRADAVEVTLWTPIDGRAARPSGAIGGRELAPGEVADPR